MIYENVRVYVLAIFQEFNSFETSVSFQAAFSGLLIYHLHPGEQLEFWSILQGLEIDPK